MPEQTNQTSVVRTERGLSIAGTRITLYDILDYLHADWPPQLIQHWLDLTDQQLSDIMAYLATHRDAVEAEYQQVVQQADAQRNYWETRNQERLARLARLPAKPGQEAAIAKLRSRKADLDLS